MARYAFTNEETDFYTTAVSTISASGTYTTASNALNVFEAEYASIYVTATGADTAASGVVTFYFVTRGPGGTWPTESTFDCDVTMSGTSSVGSTYLMDCRGVYEAKVLQIANGDATSSATNLNASASYKD